MASPCRRRSRTRCIDSQEECLVQGAGRTDPGACVRASRPCRYRETGGCDTVRDAINFISNRRLLLFNRWKRSVKIFMRASPRRSALISIEFWIDARRPPWRRDGFGMCRCRLTPMRCTRPRSRCLAITTSQFPGKGLQPTPRCGPSTAGCPARRRRDLSRCRSAVLPAPSGPQLRRYTETRWRRQMATPGCGSGAGRL